MAFKIVITMATVLASAVAHASMLTGDRHLTAQLSPPLCQIENGFDYVGEDLSNVAAPSAEECCGKCASATGCGAFTWTNFKNGTCWLKKTRGQVVANPNAKSAPVFKQPRTFCEVQYNVDIVGNDIGTAPSTSNPLACCDLCRAKPGCRAYSWANVNGGTCYFKSGRGQSVVKYGVHSADVYPASSFEQSQFCAQEIGVDYVGGDIGNKPSANAGGCCGICQGFAGCRAFSWTNYNGGTCWLKSAKGNTVAKAGVTSAVAVQVPDLNVAFERDVDFIGNDIGNYRTNAPDVCAYTCYYFVAGCSAVTWTDFNGGTCWYKSRKDKTQAKAGALSYAFPWQ